jgi:hypothetical protein
MNIKTKAFILVPGCMILILAIGLWPGFGCLAAEKKSKIRSITPAESAASPVNVRAEDYFDIVGTLNLIESGRVVIGNTELRLAGRASTSGVSQYDQVGAQLNKKGEVTAIELISDLPH